MGMQEKSIQERFTENLNFLNRDSYNTSEIQNLFFSGGNRLVFELGSVYFPTGQVVVADPLCYLYDEEFSKPLNYKIPMGTHPVHLALFASPVIGLRVVAARLNISENTPVRYEIAMPEGFSVEQLNQPGVLTGFGVDAGLASFSDKQTAEKYGRFIKEWHEEHPNKNHYDDYFAAFFAESYKQQPNIQREDGDFILWAIPESENNIAMFASGFGDGLYQALWGFDAEGEICELVVPMINPELFKE